MIGQPLPHVLHTRQIFLVGSQVLDNHGHVRILGGGQLGIKIDIQRTLAAGALLKLEGVFLFQQDIFQVAAHDGAVEFLETLAEELVVEEVPAG